MMIMRGHQPWKTIFVAIVLATFIAFEDTLVENQLKWNKPRMSNAMLNEIECIPLGSKYPNIQIGF